MPFREGGCRESQFDKFAASLARQAASLSAAENFMILSKENPV
jgi:hypothetical protein